MNAIVNFIEVNQLACSIAAVVIVGIIAIIRTYRKGNQYARENKEIKNRLNLKESV